MSKISPAAAQCYTTLGVTEDELFASAAKNATDPVGAIDARIMTVILNIGSHARQLREAVQQVAGYAAQALEGDVVELHRADWVVTGGQRVEAAKNALAADYAAFALLASTREGVIKAELAAAQA
jgi:hypothetical protein